jgi:hypothetical protein
MLFKSKKVTAPGCISAGFYICVSYGKNSNKAYVKYNGT